MALLLSSCVHFVVPGPGSTPPPGPGPRLEAPGSDHIGLRAFLGIAPLARKLCSIQVSFFYCDINCIENERSDCTLYASVLN